MKEARELIGRLKGDAVRFMPDYLPAIMETRLTNRMPPYIERTLPTDRANVLLQSLITPEQQLRLHTLVSELPEGTFRWREAAGIPEDGSRHVHDFVIVKSDSATQLFYVDPEHGMGKSINKRRFGLPRRGDLRPQVNVLYGIELTPDNTVSRVSILRYRAAAIPAEQVRLNKPSEQLVMAQLMLQTGALPEILQGKENEVTFHFDFRPTADGHQTAIRARAARDTDSLEQRLEGLTNGQSLSPYDPVEGQLRRFRAIVRTYFPRYIQEKRFQPVNG